MLTRSQMTNEAAHYPLSQPVTLFVILFFSILPFSIIILIQPFNILINIHILQFHLRLWPLGLLAPKSLQILTLSLLKDMGGGMKNWTCEEERIAFRELQTFGSRFAKRNYL